MIYKITAPYVYVHGRGIRYILFCDRGIGTRIPIIYNLYIYVLLIHYFHNIPNRSIKVISTCCPILRTRIS